MEKNPHGVLTLAISSCSLVLSLNPGDFIGLWQMSKEGRITDESQTPPHKADTF